MGRVNFLAGLDLEQPNQLPEVIERLRETSAAFVRSYRVGDIDQAGSASHNADLCFDYITNELMRVRDDSANPPRQAFLDMLKAPTGMGVQGVTEADHSAIHAAGPGKWHLSSLGRKTQPFDLMQTLNKIKHRSLRNSNFRIEDGERHIFVVAANHMRTKQPESIAEVDVMKLCDQLEEVAKTI